MLALPQEARLLEKFAPAFTAPTYQRFVVLCVGAIVAMGRRTVSRLLWAAGPLSEGHPSSYHRFFSQAQWSLRPLAKVLAAAVLELVPKEQPVMLDGDDTVAQHRGKQVYAKGCHRDAVRSSWGHTVFKWGHKWVVLAVNVRLPLCKRCWALPVMAALYTPPPKGHKPKAKKRKGKNKTAEGKNGTGKRKRRRGARAKASRPRGPRPPRHKTPPLLARQMVAVLIHSLPGPQVHPAGGLGLCQPRPGVVLPPPP